MSSGTNEKDLLAEIDKEEEERLVNENTGGTPALDEAATAMLSGAKGGDQVSSRNTRSKSKELELSKKPMDAVKRIRAKVETLRARLIKREEDTGVSRNGMDEFAGIFDEESKGIETNLKLIEGEYVISSTRASREINKWKKLCEEETDKMRVWDEALATAIDGTDFNSLEEMRAGYDELSREKKEREGMESAILEELGLGSIEEMAGQIRKGKTKDVCAETSLELLELVTESLGVMKCDDLEEAAIEMIGLRNESKEQTDLLEEIMEIVQVKEFGSIAETIQRATTARYELEERCRELERQLTRSADVVRSLKVERDKASGMLNKYEKEIMAESDCESSDSERSTSFASQIQRLKQLKQEMKQPARPSQCPSVEETSERLETGANKKSRGTSDEISKGKAAAVSEGEEAEGAVKETKRAVRVDPSKLPPLAPFDGTKEKWKVFKDGFLLRYEQMGDSIARQMLVEMIEGRARKEYKGLPDEYKSKSVRNCLTWLKDRCLGGSLYVSLENERKLREQTVRGRKVVDVCREMEEWIDKLHTEVAKQEEMKKKQLVFLYEKEDRETHSKLLSMYEKEKSYEDMKRKLEIREYQARRESYNRSDSATKEPVREVRDSKASGSRSSGGNGMSSMNGVDRRKCFYCHGIGHEAPRCPSKGNHSGMNSTGVQCWTCGGLGHMASVCVSHESVKEFWKESSGEQAEVSSGSQQESMQSAKPSSTPILPSSRVTGGGVQGYGGSNGQKVGGNEYGSNPAGARMLVLKCDVANGGVEEKQSNRQKPAKVNGEHVNQELFSMARPDNQDDGANLISGIHLINGKNSMTGTNSENYGLFIRRFRPVKGVIGGLEVEACMDTGADVNLIDKSIVDKMAGVQMKRDCPFHISDFQGQSIPMIGTVVVDVQMEVGKKCRVGFLVSQMSNPLILLGNCALDAMGMELSVKDDSVNSASSEEQGIGVRVAPRKRRGFVNHVRGDDIEDKELTDDSLLKKELDDDTKDVMKTDDKKDLVTTGKTIIISDVLRRARPPDIKSDDSKTDIDGDECKYIVVDGKDLPFEPGSERPMYKRHCMNVKTGTDSTNDSFLKKTTADGKKDFTGTKFRKKTDYTSGSMESLRYAHNRPADPNEDIR